MCEGTGASGAVVNLEGIRREIQGGFNDITRRLNENKEEHAKIDKQMGDFTTNMFEVTERVSVHEAEHKTEETAATKSERRIFAIITAGAAIVVVSQFLIQVVL